MRQTQDHAHALTSAQSRMIVRDWLFGIGPWLLAAPFFCTALWAQEVRVTRATLSVGQVTSFPLPRYVSLKSRGQRPPWPKPYPPYRLDLFPYWYATENHSGI